MRARIVRLAMLAAVAVLAPSLATAQTAEQWVARNLEARGGLAKLEAVQAMKLTGTLTSGGMTFPLILVIKRPNLVRQETSFKGQTVVQAFDGEQAWTVNPLMMAGGAPQRIEGPPADMMREQADIDGPLVNYTSKGYKVELDGPDTVGDARAVRLQIKKKHGQVQRLWLDAETGLELKSAVEMDQGGQRVTIETLMSDYRNVNGLMIPFRLETVANGQPQGTLQLESVDLDPVVDPAIFRMPTR